MSQHISDTDITRIQLFPWKGEGYNGVFWDIDSPSESNIPEAMVEHLRTCNECYAGVLTNGRHEREQALLDADADDGEGEAEYDPEDWNYVFRVSDEI